MVFIVRKEAKQSLGNDALKLTISKIITITISMITSMLLSRLRTLHEYGTYSQILLVTNLMTSLLMLGLPNSINYFLARAESTLEREKFLSVYYTFSTILSFIVGIVLVLLSPFIVKYFNNDYLVNFIYILAVYPWAKITMSSIENVLIVYKKTTTIMIYRISNSILILLTIYIIHVTNLTFESYMLLFILIETIYAVSVYVIVKNIIGKFYIRLDKKLIRRILLFSVPIGLASVVGTLNIELDKLMIGRFLDTEQLALYTNASREMPVTVISTSLTAVLLPQLARLLKNGEDYKAINLWANATVLSYIIINFISTGLFTFASDVIVLLYSDKYLAGTSVFRVFNLVLLLRCTYFGMILNAKGKTKFILYSSIISLGINCVLNFILFRIFGFVGPAIATFISQFVINLVQLIYTAKIMNVKFTQIFPWKRLGMTTAINILLGSIFYYLKELIDLDIIIGSLLESILLSVIWGGIYLAIFFKKAKKLWTTLNN